jgi:hypothetical protein
MVAPLVVRAGEQVLVPSTLLWRLLSVPVFRKRPPVRVPAGASDGNGPVNENDMVGSCALLIGTES